MVKSLMTIKCNSIPARFDGYASTLEQYRWHRPTRHVRGYPGSHWMSPLGNYSLCIALEAARAKATKTVMKNVPNLMAILLAMAMRRYNTTHIAR